MARAGGTTKVSTYLEEQYRFLIKGIALGMPTKYLQRRAMDELGKPINESTLCQLRNPTFRAQNSKKFHKEVQRIERDFIKAVGDRKMLFPIFRAYWAFCWAEDRAAEDDHQNAVKYMDLGHKMMESVPGHRILAEACLSETMKELAADNNGDTEETEDVEILVARIRKKRKVLFKDLKVLTEHKEEDNDV